MKQIFGTKEAFIAYCDEHDVPMDVRLGTLETWDREKIRSRRPRKSVQAYADEWQPAINALKRETHTLTANAAYRRDTLPPALVEFWDRYYALVKRLLAQTRRLRDEGKHFEDCFPGATRWSDMLTPALRDEIKHTYYRLFNQHMPADRTKRKVKYPFSSSQAIAPSERKKAWQRLVNDTETEKGRYEYDKESGFAKIQLKYLALTEKRIRDLGDHLHADENKPIPKTWESFLTHEEQQQRSEELYGKESVNESVDL